VRDEKHVAFAGEKVGERLETTRKTLTAMIPEDRWEGAISGWLEKKSVQSKRAAVEEDFLRARLRR
jgi:hypothetical protein